MGFGYAGGGVTDHTLLTGKEDASGIIDHADLSVVSGKLRQSKDIWRTLQPAPYNFTTGCCAVYTGRDYIYAFAVDPISGNTQFIRYSLSTNSWAVLSPPPFNIGAGAALCYAGGGYIYALRGGGFTTFWVYTICIDIWNVLANPFPFAVGAGGSLVHTGDNYIYGFAGGGTSSFARYNISTPGWLPMATAPASINAGGSLSYPGGNYIYALRGGGTSTVYKYNISLNTWTTTPYNISYVVNNGGSLIYTCGSYIYALCGNNTRRFCRFTLSSPDTVIPPSKWMILPDTIDNINAGGSLVYANENFIYALRGGNTPDFYRYDGASEQKFGIPFASHQELKTREDVYTGIIDHAAISVTSDKIRQSKDIWRTSFQYSPFAVAVAGSLVYTGKDKIYAAIAGNNFLTIYTISTNSWELSALTPGAVTFGAGASLCYAGGADIFAFRGGNTTDFWAYIPDTNNWIALQSAPATVGAGAGLTFVSLPYIYALRGNGTTDFWRYDTALNIWEIMTSTPFALGASGGAIVYTHGAQLYVLQGGGPTRLFLYNIADNIWTVIAFPPVTAGAGCSLVYTYGNYVYALMGGNTQNFYRYSLITNEWTISASTPNPVGAGAALCYANENFIYAFRGNNSPTFWRYDGGSEQRFKFLPHGKVHQYKGDDSIEEITALNTKWQREEWRSFTESPTLWGDIIDSGGTGNVVARYANTAIYTGSDATSYFVLGLYPLSAPDGLHFTEYLNFDKKIVIAAIVKILARSDAGVATFRIQDGNNHANLLTSKGFGFRFITVTGTPILQGMWHDGVNLYTVDLAPNYVLNKWYYLRVEFRTRKVTTATGIASIDVIDFYVDNVLLATVTDTTPGANPLPSGEIANAAELIFTVHNSADAANNEMTISASSDNFRYQHPL